MKHLGTKELQTKRLYLRKFTIEDATFMYHNWAKDEDVTRYLMWKPHQDEEETKRIIQDWILHYQEADFYQWAIVLKGVKEPIGCISVVRNNDSLQKVEIGYCIGKKWWHQGIMKEALTKVISFFFQEVKVHRIEAGHHLLNPNSGKVMVSCGMRYEGIMRDGGINNQGGFCDIAKYAILISDML